MANAEQAEEIAALSAIYGDDRVACTPPDAAAYSSGTDATVSVTLPRAGGTIVAACFTLPVGYPSGGALPRVELEGLPRGLREPVMARLRALLGAAEGGGACLYALVEHVRERLEEADRSDAEGAAAAAAAQAPAPRRAVGPLELPQPAAARGLAIAHSDAVTVQKSVFIAHMARVESRADVDAVVAELLQDSRIARATHNIMAWRLRDAATGALSCDNDDDGEDAAGGRLAFVLESMKVDNAVVVVSRWFGGILLGPLRFKCINDVARRLVEDQPWYAGRKVAPAGKR